MSMEARLASETDLAGFREEARALLAHQIPPDDVRWQTAFAQNAEFFSDPTSPGCSSSGTWRKRRKAFILCMSRRTDCAICWASSMSASIGSLRSDGSYTRRHSSR